MFVTRIVRTRRKKEKLLRIREDAKKKETSADHVTVHCTPPKRCCEL